MSDKVAVVTGSNKGLGFAIVQGLCRKFDGTVYLTSRNVDNGRAAVDKLKQLDLHPEFHQLDVTDTESVRRFRDHIKEKHGGLDILINNAGIAAYSLFNSYEEGKNIIDTNYRSVLTIQDLIYPLVRDDGRILNISSDCGHLSNLRNKHWIDVLSSESLTINDIEKFIEWYLDSSRNGTFKRDDFADRGTIAAYRVAKMALSALTMLQQKDLELRNISINSMHPGFIRTDMTRGIGFLTPEDAATTPIYIVLDAPQTLKGAYLWHDGTVVDWYDYKSDRYFKIWSIATWLPFNWFSDLIEYCRKFFGYK